MRSLKKGMLMLFILLIAFCGSMNPVKAKTKVYHTQKYYKIRKTEVERLFYSTFDFRYYSRYKQIITKTKIITKTITYYKHQKKVNIKTRKKIKRKRYKYNKHKMSIYSVKKQLPQKVYKLFHSSKNNVIVTNPRDKLLKKHGSKISGVFSITENGTRIAVREYDKGTLLHELGHFLDYKTNYISTKSDFIKIYKAERNKYEKSKISSYYRNSSEEYFAECFSDYCLHYKKFRKQCPKTAKYIKKIVKNL